jgi:hypothetical protein
MPQICNMGPTALLPPLKKGVLRILWTWVPKASTLPLHHRSHYNARYSIYQAKAYFPSFHMHMPQLTKWLQTEVLSSPWMDVGCSTPVVSNCVTQNAFCTHIPL